MLNPCINLNCDNMGTITGGDGEPEQCQFCYTEPDSIFNAITALQAKLEEWKSAASAESEELNEMIEKNTIHKARIKELEKECEWRRREMSGGRD